MNNFEHIGKTLLPAVAYGDAAGLPFEKQSAAAITKEYGHVDHLYPTSHHILFQDHPTPGGWSDDTQLSIAVVESLMEADGFDVMSLAEAHIRAYLNTPDVDFKGNFIKRGWGHSSTLAVRRMFIGTNPLEAGVEAAPGNGVLMKMAPLVYWQVAREIGDVERWRQYDKLTQMTHRSDIARLTTRVHGDVLRSLLIHGFDKHDTPGMIQESIRLHEKALNMKYSLSVVNRLANPYTTQDDILEETDGQGFKAHQTLAMAYGALIVSGAIYKKSIYTAVNLGGDTDSTAAITGTMALFASRSEVRLPSDAKELDNVVDLKKLSKQFARQALKGI